MLFDIVALIPSAPLEPSSCKALLGVDSGMPPGVQLKVRLETLSGLSSAHRKVLNPPIDWPTKWASLIFKWSMIARMSSLKFGIVKLGSGAGDRAKDR